MRSPRARIASLIVVASLAWGAAACGSRSNLATPGHVETGGAGGLGGTSSSGGTGGSAGATVTTSTVVTTPVQPCSSLEVQPTFVLSATSGVVSRPRTALLTAPSDVLLTTLVTSAGGIAGTLVAGRLDAFADWPPSYTDVTQIDAGVADYDLGAGPKGPVALVQHQGTGALLFSEVFPTPSWFDVLVDPADDILFVTAVEGRYFYGQSIVAPDHVTLSLGSYQPGGLPQVEQPPVCMKGPARAAAIPLDNAFLGAIAAPNAPPGNCNTQALEPTMLLPLTRYESPPGQGTSLIHSPGATVVLDAPESIVHLGLAPTPFGAWVVFQADGATALTPPPIYAMPFDGAGQPLGSAQFYPVSQGGYIPPEISVASLGDTLAVAWVDTIDPSAPVIVVQILHPNGSPGPTASIPTNDAWFSGGLRILASPDEHSLLVSWAGPPADGVAAVARVDCLN